MAGTLTISTLSDGTNSTSSTNCIQGSAKAWVNFNGTGTVAIRASYNVSSITDNGTGQYTINFTNALVDANYAVTGVAGGTAGGGDIESAEQVLARTSSLFMIYVVNNTGSAVIDCPQVNLAIFR